MGDAHVGAMHDAEDCGSGHMSTTQGCANTTRGADTVALDAVLTVPAAGATGVDPSTSFTVIFNDAVIPATVNAATLQVRDSSATSTPGNTVPGSYTVQTSVPAGGGVGSATAVFVPATPFGAGATVSISLTAGILDDEGLPLVSPRIVSFTIRP
jgi:hypothetical protein